LLGAKIRKAEVRASSLKKQQMGFYSECALPIVGREDNEAIGVVVHNGQMTPLWRLQLSPRQKLPRPSQQ
jgi:hypothetical protein